MMNAYYFKRKIFLIWQTKIQIETPSYEKSCHGLSARQNKEAHSSFDFIAFSCCNIRI